jgi:hypothetical protein
VLRPSHRAPCATPRPHRYGSELGEYAPLSVERRRELVAHGFPDDGYDYLMHVRALTAKGPKPRRRKRVGGTCIGRVCMQRCAGAG